MQRYVKSGMLGGRKLTPYGSNHPKGDSGTKRYFADVTKAYTLEHMQWASNNVSALVQGLDTSDFYAFTPCVIRVCNVIEPTTGQPLQSDWQRIMIGDGEIDYIPRGAKVVFGGNTYLVTNPDNVQSVVGTAIVRRCNATWCRHDYYGNVLKEPFCYGQGTWDLATGNKTQENMRNMDAYQHAIMQLSPETKDLAMNVRMLLGSASYTVRGLVNFVQEFSEDIDSTHIQYFDFDIAQALEANDDAENHIANGKAFAWEIALGGGGEMNTATERQLTATSRRNGETVEPMPEKPIDYTWESSDAAVATVDENGLVTATGEGECEITCRLKQNPDMMASTSLRVTEADDDSGLVWKALPPHEMTQYGSCTFEAVYVESDEDTEKAVAYTYSGANERCYTATQTGNKVRLEAWEPSNVPLTVTATCEGEKLQYTIRLRGW